jgi:hypothetical protein
MVVYHDDADSGFQDSLLESIKSNRKRSRQPGEKGDRIEAIPETSL